MTKKIIPPSEMTLEELIAHTDYEPSTDFSIISTEYLEEHEMDRDNRDENMPSPENVLDEKERLDEIQEALSTLNAREQYVIGKIFFEGKNQKEVAAETNWPQQTVNWLKNQALLKLKNNPAILEAWNQSLNRKFPIGHEYSQNELDFGENYEEITKEGAE